MPLDIVLGDRKNKLAVNGLLAVLRDETELDGTLYVGYPVLRSADEAVFVDALLTTQQHGVVIIDFSDASAAESEKIESRQSDLHAVMLQRLLSVRELRHGRVLAIDIAVVTVSPNVPMPIAQEELIAGPMSALPELLRGLKPITQEQLRLVNSAVQRVGTLKPTRKRNSVTRPDSRGAIMKKLELEIANLDQWQKAGAIEMPDGPQRIRGLAGSGKTIVLALKAAYMYAQNPDWRILVTFHTRSLYQQFRELIRRFTFEQLLEDPDWNRLRVMHSWGSSNQPGVYYEICSDSGVAVKTFGQAREQYGSENAFEGICNELRDHVVSAGIKPTYDAVLIDEGQDLPQSFFELAYLITQPPHRVIFAYDELQNLNDKTVPTPDELFGSDSEGHPRIASLGNSPGEPRRDIVLPTCYRNTPWALTVAHALGFGIYRKQSLVQFFEDESIFEDIGYEVTRGELQPGQKVVLRRKSEATPDFFLRLLNPEDAIQVRSFTSEEEQAATIAASIQKNVTDDELELRDILVVLCNAVTAKRDAVPIVKALRELGLPAHVAGVDSALDEIFSDDSIAISGIYRAKGNEAPMVYVAGAQFGTPEFELIKRRNVLFTSITRSRAWVRIFGVGADMNKIAAEVAKVAAKNYSLDFTVPTAAELAKLRTSYRDVTSEERARLRQVNLDFESLINDVAAGSIPMAALPPRLRKAIEKIKKNES